MVTMPTSTPSIARKCSRSALLVRITACPTRRRLC
jgi:hypothetical protein